MEGSADHISTLPDDVLLQIVESVGSGGGAARTCMLSRRWSDLWTRLPEIVVILHDVPFRSLKAALKDVDRPGMFQRLLLNVSVPFLPSLMVSSLESLLIAMAALSPADLRLTLPRKLQVVGSLDVELPSFDRATSIQLRAGYLRLAPPRARTWFPKLKRLSLSGCHVDLAELIPRCPCLRFLTMNTTGVAGLEKLTVHSQWLQELVIESSNKVRTRIHVEAPVLKQLAVRFHALGDLGVSVLAPMVEKVSWRCSYSRAFYRLGLWGLLEVAVKTTEEGVHVMSMHMCAQDSCKSLNAELRFACEIHKHLVTNFSGLDLHLRTKGHVFGAFVLRLLAMHPIHTPSIRNLKVILLRSEVTTTSCQLNCLCDEPKDWRTQIVTLADLESMEIQGVNGEDHELDFLNVIFTCAPVLKRVTLRFVDGATPCVDWCTKINNMFMLYPCVEQGQIQWVFHGCHVTFS